MSELYIKKYIPKKSDDFIIHKNIINKIDNLLKNDNIMNLFIYGKEGCGKYTIARYLIENYYNDECKNELNIQKNDSKEIKYFKSKYHYEIIINNYNFNDFNLVKSLLNTIVNKGTFRFTDKKNIIIIKNVNLIKNNINKLLRIYIEKYYLFNNFIFISNYKMINTFLGVFCNIRTPQPTDENLKLVINNIIKKEKLKIEDKDLNYIVKSSNRNFYNALNNLEYSFITGNYEKVENPTNCKLKFLFKILKKKNINSIIMIREILNELIVENVEINKILVYLLNKFKKDLISEKISKNLFYEIFDLIKNTSHNTSIGLRPIIHLENCMIKIIDIL